MSLQGRLIRLGLGLGLTSTQARRLSKTGVMTAPPHSGLLKGVPFNSIDPESSVTFFDDFFRFTEYDEEVGGWDLKEVQSIGEAVADVDTADGHYLTLTSGDAEDDSAAVQWNGAGIFDMTISGDLWFQTRVKISNVASDIVVGMAEAGSDPAQTNNGLYFLGSAGAAGTVAPVNIIGGAATVESSTTGFSTSWKIFGFHYDYSASKVFWYIDDTLVATGTLAPAEVAMSPFFHVQADGAAARSLYVDYVKIIQLRS